MVRRDRAGRRLAVTRTDAVSDVELRPLLEPTSVAVIGASGRPGRPGHAVLAALRAAGFGGAVYPVTPTYDEIEGWSCLADIVELPGAVDLAVIAGAAPRVPEQLQGAIAAGVRSAFVLANAAIADASGASVLEEVRDLVAASGIPLLGPNSLGFVNFARGTAVTWTPRRRDAPGPVALDLAVRLDVLLREQPRPADPVQLHRARRPGGFGRRRRPDPLRAVARRDTRRSDLPGDRGRARGGRGRLAEAAERDVPVVAIRPGRSERSRQQIESHAGRMAGSDAAFEALFRALRGRSRDDRR